MSLSDPISDMFNRIRNAQAAGYLEVAVPNSRMKAEIVRVMKREGYLGDVDARTEGGRGFLHLQLKYDGQGKPAIRGLRRRSRPGLRQYVRSNAQPRVLGGMGIAILTTPAGVMTGQEARAKNVGGEVICHVW